MKGCSKIKQNNLHKDRTYRISIKYYRVEKNKFI